MTTKDHAIDSIIGADGIVVITAKRLAGGFTSVNTYTTGEDDLASCIANEMLFLARKIVFGDEEEVSRVEETQDSGEAEA